MTYHGHRAELKFERAGSSLSQMRDRPPIFVHLLIVCKRVQQVIATASYTYIAVRSCGCVLRLNRVPVDAQYA